MMFKVALTFWQIPICLVVGKMCLTLTKQADLARVLKYRLQEKCNMNMQGLSNEKFQKPCSFLGKQQGQDFFPAWTLVSGGNSTGFSNLR